MNPLHWKREHQVAWGIACVLGAVVGLAYGLGLYQLRCCGGTAFVAASAIFAILPYPMLYWPWVAFGAAIGTLAFYLARLLK